MTNPYTTPITEQFRLYELGKGVISLGSDFGRTLDSVLQTYYGMPNGLADLTATFVDDMDNVPATFGDNNGGKTWCCPSTELVAGSASLSKYSDGCYTQQAAGVLGLVVERSTSVFKHICNAATATYGANFDATPIINWAQQYGYFECKYQAGDPTGTSTILWSGFWMRSINKIGGTSNPFIGDIEDDIVEAYASDPNISSGEHAMHTTLHKHEPVKGITAPGNWGRDVAMHNYTGLVNKTELGTDANFKLWNAYHLWSELIMPDYRWYFFDRKLVGKLVQVPEVQCKYFPYVWHTVNAELGTGWASGVPATMKVDYVKCWQHPDLQTTPLGSNIVAGSTLAGNQMNAVCLTGGGTANAKTLTSVFGGTPYTNKRMYLAKFPNANTGACTLNISGGGAKNVYTFPATAAARDVFPNSGTPGALTGGEIGIDEWKCLQYLTSLNGGAGGFLLINPHYSMETPAIWSPTLISLPAKTLDIPALEAALVEKHAVDNATVRALFPATHPARTPIVQLDFTPPRMPVSRSFTRVAGLTVGASIGTVTALNVPTDQVRYHQVGANSHYVTNPATGEITVASGYTTAVGSEEFVIYAWPVTPRQIVRGSNATRVLLDIKSDDDFDFSYFSNLLSWLDAQDTATLTLDGSNNVLNWADKGPQGIQWTDDPTLADTPPVYNATGFNGLPAVVGTAGTRMLTGFIGAARYADAKVTNVNTRSTPGVQMSLQLQGTSRLANLFDHTQAHMGLFVWTKTPSAWTFWANGIQVGPLSTALQTGIISDGWLAYALDSVTAGSGGLGRLYDNGHLFNASTLASGLDSAVTLIGRGDDLLTQTLIDKIFGYMATRVGLRSLLPVTHPYKTTAPKMWRDVSASASLGWLLDETNTGLARLGINGDTLPLYTGSLKPTAGTVISDKLITNFTELDLSNGVTIERCKIKPTGAAGRTGIVFGLNPDTGGDQLGAVNITDCDIDASGIVAVGDQTSIYKQAAIRGAANVTRCNIWGMGTGIAYFGCPSMPVARVEGNYVHDLRGGLANGDQSHNESGTVRAFNGTDLQVVNNRFVSHSGSDSAALFIQAIAGTVDHVTVEGNLFDCLNWCLALETNTYTYGFNMRARNNRYIQSSAKYAYVTGGPGWAEWTNQYVANSGATDWIGAPIAQP